MTSALEGITVLDFTRIFQALLYPDAERPGADVIKVERPESGDLIRYDVPHPRLEGALSSS
jgi:crotonobetainyl-CoA:carnitine CoA-transferase CaiB-like acyl-CoA transferase